MKNLLLIDSTVTDYQVFVDSVNADTIPFVYTLSTTRQDLLNFIGESESTIDRIGIVNERMGTLEGTPFFSPENIQFFTSFIQTFSVKHIDFLACNTINQYGWNRLYSTLQNETNVIVGASDNNTGNLKYGGDWIMETTSEDVELIYFTTNIQYYQYVLNSITITSFTPSSGTKNTLVTITGSNFGNVTSVLFGTVAATNPIISSTTILVNAPINNKSVAITLIGNGFSVISSTNFTYNTNPTLFTSSTNDPSDKLLSELNLTDGIDNTGILKLGSSYTNINFSGAVNAITVSSGDNSSSLATTAFVKAQGYATGSGTVSFTGYAQMAVAQTWSALQSFSSGILSSNYNALTSTSTVSFANNLTTGILNIGTSTATVNLNVPLTPTYTAAPVSGQTGYTVTLAPLNTPSYRFSGGNLVYRYVPIVPGTYVATATAEPFISLDFFKINFAALTFTPSNGVDINLYAESDKLIFNAGLKSTPVGTNLVLSRTIWSITSTMYIPAGYTTLALVTNTYKGPSGNSPFSTTKTTMTVTRIS
jgi:hypothetical protein